MKCISVYLVIFLSIVSTANGASLIYPNDANILYTGRVDFNNPLGPVFGWSGVSIMANFEGTGLKGRFNDGGSNYFYVIIDDGEPVTLGLSSGEAQYDLASGLADTVHKVEIVKKTEGYDGHTTFLGFELDDGKGLAAAPARPPLKLEFYGDSHGSGYSCECTCDSGSAEYKNNYMAFPGITSRMLGAEYSSITWSGIGIITAKPIITEVWDRTLPNDSESVWDFNDFVPDAVVINLGANDYYWGVTEEEIVPAWEDFVTNYLRPVYPDAHIVLVNSYGWAFDEPADYVHIAVENLHAAGDTNVSWFKFPWLWSQAHAVICEQAGHANILAAHLAEQLGMPQPEPADFSCIPDSGEVINGSFEEDSLPDSEADGWRTFKDWWENGTASVIEGEGAHSGTRFMEASVGNKAGYGGCWMATDGREGVTYTATAYMRATAGDTGKLKVEFKDQGQNIIAAVEGEKTVGGEWARYSTTGTAPGGTWQVTVVCVVDSAGNTVQYDDVTLTEYAFDFSDLQKLAESWLGSAGGSDIWPVPFGDGVVNFSDFGVMADYWLN